MKELFKKIKKVFFLIPLFYPFLVFARDYHLPFLPGPKKIDAGSLETFLQDLFSFGLGVAGFLAVVFLIWGSIEYMLYPSNLTQERKAKEKIWNAIFGLILILATYLILYNINPDLVKIRLPKEMEVSIPISSTSTPQ